MYYRINVFCDCLFYSDLFESDRYFHQQSASSFHSPVRRRLVPLLCCPSGANGSVARPLAHHFVLIPPCQRFAVWGTVLVEDASPNDSVDRFQWIVALTAAGTSLSNEGTRSPERMPCPVGNQSAGVLFSIQPFFLHQFPTVKSGS